MLLATNLFAQRSINIEKKDSTYRLVEYVINSGDTVLKNVTTQWLDSRGLVSAIYSLARGSERRIEQLESDLSAARSEHKYYSATIDTLVGVGAYDKAVMAELQRAIQGKWFFIADKKQYTVLIEDNTLTGWKNGTATVKSPKEIVLKTEDTEYVFVQTGNFFTSKVNDKIYYLIR
jgi:hypothetical protein